MKRFKYPRTFHLPWSEGISKDDRVLKSIDQFHGKNVVVTEKMDGENTTLYRDGLHARSLDSKDHESRHWIKAFWSTIRYDIPLNFRVCGENLYAKHSIYYKNLKSFFYGFSVWIEDYCCSWEYTLRFFNNLSITPVPILYIGPWDEEKIRLCYDPNNPYQEGYVVRIVDGFSYNEFNQYVAKFVRKGHVQTDTHWMHQKIMRNELGDI